MGPRRAAGFTLIEIVVVVVIIAVLTAMAAALTRGVAAAQKRSLTATRMAGVDAALVQFVSQQKRLPCPADGTLDSSNANAGVEAARTAAGCTDATQTNGVVPWRALGLSEVDATDGWDRRLTYRIDPLLAADSGMNMSMCDPAGTEAGAGPTACNAACTSTALANCTPPYKFLNSRGLQVRNKAGTVLTSTAASATIAHTGAAYVLISAGESGGGAYLSSGQLGVSIVGDGTEELKNYASLPFTSNVVTYYVDDSLAEAADTSHFDDLVSRPSVLAVITKAGLGPRSH
jgi:prepilin-type N-terminal cleavage/methylation domain-containing protein